MPKFRVDIERSAYRIISIELEAESEAAAEEKVLAAVDKPEWFPRGDEHSELCVRYDNIYDDEESAWEVLETNEVDAHS